MMQHISRAPDNSIIARVLDSGHVVILEQGLHDEWSSAQADPALVAYVEQPQVPEVPQIVTMRQARLALFGAGLLAGVEAAIEALPEPQRTAARIEWDYSSEVHRTRPFVQTLAGALNLTSEQLDALFTQAAQL